MTLRTERLGIRVGGRRLIDDLTLDLQPGRVCVLLGANGAGKSTLLHALAGDLHPDTGSVTLDGRPLRQWPARALAQRRAVLTQHDGLRFPFTAAEVVALAHLPWAGTRDRHAAAIDDDALRAAGAAEYAQRPYLHLSGGERSRVRFARCLAQVWQQPGAWLLLDEPVAHADFAHQHHCLAEARRQARTGLGVLVTLHDPNLAARYADDAALLRGGRLLAAGPTDEVLTPENLSAVYGMDIRRGVDTGGRGRFHARVD